MRGYFAQYQSLRLHQFRDKDIGMRKKPEIVTEGLREQPPV